ncbi:MAG: hypothetical protein D6806_15260 [Deltaproteobacteria bacterium]|nr:MAG: hypothetical protein D6806_15260 [Deltaproteobacteria bacterium]
MKEKELVTESITLKPIYYRKKEEAEVVAGVFTPGQKRRVWFDPAGTGQAYLVPGGGVGSKIYLVLGLCLVAADAAITAWLLSIG